MLPLEGIKVLDLSNYVPGALCTMILADMGAEVIKIEPAEPLAFEGVGYSVKGEERRRETAFFTLNRNKKSLGLNLRSEAGRDVFLKMAKDADVVIEGYRPGVVKRMGIDYEATSAINPGVVYCSLSGYGQDGPYRLYPGHDINYISLAGVLGVIGPAQGPPSVPLNIIADFAGVSLYGTIGILLALRVRDLTGRGQYIDHTYMEGALHQISWFTQDYFRNGSVLSRGSSWVRGDWACYGVYETKDGKYLSIGCLEPHFWDNLCRALGREDFMEPHWSMAGTTFREPDERDREIRKCLEETFKTRTRDEWFDLLIQKDVPVGKVYSIDEVFRDPQILARNMVIEIDDPKAGKVKQIGILPKLSATPGSVRALAPLHGEHTDELLLRYGYGKDEIEKLRREKVAG
jgi:crotonobetainyl-CoA:carnitine CoA-transferase CaiB-like acyl-CoA transferase